MNFQSVLLIFIQFKFKISHFIYLILQFAFLPNVFHQLIDVSFSYFKFRGEKKSTSVLCICQYIQIFFLSTRQWLACWSITKNVVHGFIKV